MMNWIALFAMAMLAATNKTNTVSFQQQQPLPSVAITEPPLDPLGHQQPQHYCGRLLISVLHLVCQGQYNGPNGQLTRTSLASPINFHDFIHSERLALENLRQQHLNRIRLERQWQQMALVSNGQTGSFIGTTTAPTIMFQTNPTNYIKLPDEWYHWWLLADHYGHYGHNTTITRFRIKRGIVEECCHNSCTVPQLRTYCVNSTNTPTTTSTNAASSTLVNYSNDYEL